MKIKHIVVTGANGQLGQEFQKLRHEEFRFTFLGSTELDITNSRDVTNTISTLNPDIIINCAAYTAVDQAEQEVDQAFSINDHGANNLAIIAEQLQTKLIHISTDYVYHIDKDSPLIESDSCNPLGIYGKSKRAGELSIISQLDNHLIIRVSWLYGAQRNNFVKTMIKLGKEREELNIVSDQYGAPTYSRDLVRAIIDIIQSHSNITGIYNYCNRGKTTWMEFAKEIFDYCKIECKVSGINTSAYGAPAPRPLWSVMSTDKIQNLLSKEIPHWKESLADCLEELGPMT